MSRNAFSPPAAPVTDVEPAPAEMPRDVVNACRLVWASFVVSLLDAIFEIVVSLKHPHGIAGVVEQIIGCAVGLLFTVWIAAKLARGRNWMRLLVTITVVGGLLLLPLAFLFLFLVKGDLSAFFKIYTDDPVTLAATVAQFACNIWYTLLLNTPPAKAWFAWHKYGGPAPA